MSEEEFKIGDTVMILETKQVGKIVGFEDGKWKIAVNPGTDILVESAKFEKRELLFG